MDPACKREVPERYLWLVEQLKRRVPGYTGRLPYLERLEAAQVRRVTEFVGASRW